MLNGYLEEEIACFNYSSDKIVFKINNACYNLI